MKYIFITILCILNFSNALKICVVGASSSLGREVIYQGINNFGYEIIGITNSPNKICVPYRGTGLDDMSNKIPIIDNKLNILNYLQEVPDYDAIIFSLGGTAFEKNDYSDKVTKKFLKKISNNCNSISLVSAYGVGESIDEANLGIVSMRNWYLKEVYRAKGEQEKMINEFTKDNIHKFIYRPKVLSYGETIFGSTSREDFAKIILNDIKSVNELK
jgi:putative NADH-flavin reductase